MLPRIDLRGDVVDDRVATRLPRARLDVAAAVADVAPLCDDVRRRGEAAVREASQRFDGVTPPRLRVPAELLEESLSGLDPAVRRALEEAARRARLVHSAQCRPDQVVDVGPGARVTERWLPVDRVGLYVPGGRVAYPSSVVMNAVPALVAGVRSIAVASPPKAQLGGWPDPVVLAACALLGIDEVYAVGGAQALAMLAYGLPEAGVTRVDLLTGPGNVYVAAAKRVLRGVVGTDAEAGPTEIAVLADETADPAHVAADLLAQAEHDPLAACLVVTTSAELAADLDRHLAQLVPSARHRAAVESALGSGGQSACVVVDDLAAGLAVVDAWAPEHLEVLTVDAAGVARRVRNAGAVFVGPFSPVSLGDYLAGSNHVLPTGGTARHTGGLSVASFLRVVHLVEYAEPALREVSGHLAALGAAEDLPAHVAAVQVRLAAPGAPAVAS